MAESHEAEQAAREWARESRGSAGKPASRQDIEELPLPR
jgi:hypothetical protein